MCPYFYNSAFENNFLAVKKEDVCIAKFETKEWPTEFKMGYKEDRIW